MKLWEYIKDNMMKNPCSNISERSSKLTFEEMVLYSENFAEKLKNEKCCAILCQSEFFAGISILACFASGVTAVPLPYRYGKLYFENIINAVSPTCIISDLSGELSITYISDSAYAEPEIHPAVIMFTSGTTGNPKGVMLSEENIIANVKDILSYFKIDKNDSVLISRPLYHCAVLTGEFIVSLIRGLNVFFYSQKFNSKIISDIIKKNKITVFCGTPTVLNILARFYENISEKTLRIISISGECMSDMIGKRLINSFGSAKLYHVYGLTEACPRVSFLSPEFFSEHFDSVGTPLKSVKVKIINFDGNEASENEEGVLWVKGPNIMLGYYNNKKQTEKVIKNGWLCTGDIAVTDSNGFLKIKGRNDDLIIRGGMNIYPQEIENRLRSDRRVRDVFVYGIKDDREGMKIGMKISGNFENKDEVKKMCIEMLPPFQIPTVICLMDEISRNGFGKIIRRHNYDKV